MNMYETVKSLCAARDMSIRELEYKMGFSYGSIAKWKDHTPAYEKVVKVANFFHVPPAVLRDDVRGRSSDPKATKKLHAIKKEPIFGLKSASSCIPIGYFLRASEKSPGSLFYAVLLGFMRFRGGFVSSPGSAYQVILIHLKATQKLQADHVIPHIRGDFAGDRELAGFLVLLHGVLGVLSPLSV